jgi:hypothetical protein
MMLDPATARAMGVPDEFTTQSLFKFLLALWRAAHPSK